MHFGNYSKERKSFPAVQGEGVSDRPDNLVARWRAGDPQAAVELYDSYAARLIALARTRLSSKLAQRVDAEDVVQSAYRSFFGRTAAGQYQAEQGGDLWRLLLTITLGKLQHQVERHTAQKRGVHREQNFATEDSLQFLQPHLAARDPSPVEAVAMTEELEAVMARLEPLPRRILELRLQGHLLEDIAATVGCSQRTVRRILERIKQQLRDAPPEATDQ